VDDAAPVLIDANALTDFCTRAFTATGMPEEGARLTAETLVVADLRGVESHGTMRLPIYVQRLLRGVMAAKPNITVRRQTRSTAVVDGDNGMGQVVSAYAMDLAIKKAESEGEPAFVSVGNSNHFGAAAYFVEMAARHHMIGFAYTISGINHMVPWGGAEAMLGNNPFAVAFPLPASPPIVLDMACSVAARGKIMVAAKEGKPIPADWAVDRYGAPTTDAQEALAGFVSPVGGPKGYALTLTIGLISTMLSNAYFGSEVKHMYEDFENPQNIGHLFGVLPISAFEDLDIYDRRIAKAAADIHGVKRSAGIEKIFLPGEREARLAQHRRHNGLPIAGGVVAELRETRAKLSVDFPPPLSDRKR
jgi:LDH2 family malate/lactate/ureidoglycolate dehydrogenase